MTANLINQTIIHAAGSPPATYVTARKFLPMKRALSAAAMAGVLGMIALTSAHGANISSGGSCAGGQGPCGSGGCSSLGCSIPGNQDTSVQSFNWSLNAGHARFPFQGSFLTMMRFGVWEGQVRGQMPRNFDQVFDYYFRDGGLVNRHSFYLGMETAEITSDILDPKNLTCDQLSANVEIIKQGDSLRQIVTDDTFVDIVPQDIGFHIKLYHASERGAKGTLLYTPSGIPFVEVIFRTTDLQAFTNTIEVVHIDRRGSGTKVDIQRFIRNTALDTVTHQTFTGSLSGDTVAEGPQVREEVITYSARGKPYDYTLVRETKMAKVDPTGNSLYGDLTLVDRRFEQYRDLTINSAGGDPRAKRLVKLVEGYNTNESRETSYEWYDGVANPQLNGRLKWVKRPDGSWEYYEYTNSETAATSQEIKYEPWQNMSFTTDTTQLNSLARKTTTMISSEIAMTRTVHVKGVKVADETRGMVTQGDGAILLTTGKWTGTDWLYSNVQFHSQDAAELLAGKIEWKEDFDGTAEKYSYSGTPGADTTVTVLKGAGNHTNVYSGTKTDRIYNEHLQADSEKVYDIEHPTPPLESWTGSSPDGMGRPLRIEYNGNSADYETRQYGCCGLEQKRNRDGSIEIYFNDHFTRTYRQQSNRYVTDPSPVYTSTKFDGLTTTVTRAGVLISQTTRSLGGLTTTTVSPSRKSVNADDRLITRVVQDPTARSATSSYQVGAVWVEQGDATVTSVTNNYRDGRISSVSGDAVTDVNYTYDTYNEGVVGILTTFTSSGFISRTYTDPLGRTAKSVSPATGTTTYGYYAANTGAGLRGKLSSVTDADTVATTYGYNARGERTTTTRVVPLATGTTNQVTTITNDVVSGVTTAHGTFAGAFHHQSQSIATNVTVSNSYVSLDRLTNITKTLTGDTVTVTNRPDANGVVTSTIVHPDGTKTVQTTTPADLGNIVLTRQFAAGANTAIDPPISSTTNQYDTLNRLLSVSDSRTGTDGKTIYSSFTESGTPLVTTQGARITSNVCDELGRVIQTTLPDRSSVTNTSYWPAGQIKAQWGSQTYPTLRTYNEQGQLITLYTYRNLTTVPTNATGAAVTTWIYNATTGRLDGKTYADGPDAGNEPEPGPSYTYSGAGRLETRTTARGVITTYGYRSGYLSSVTYTNEPTLQPVTPKLEYIYDALGRISTVKRGGSDHAFYSYRSDLQPNIEIQQIDSLNLTLTRTYETSANGLAGRLKGYSFPDGSTTRYATWSYDTAGRYSSVTNGTDTFTYGYRYEAIAATTNPAVPAHHQGSAASNAVESYIPFTLDGPRVDVTLAYDPTRDVLYSRENKLDTTLSKFSYTVNELGQRKVVVTSGSAFNSAFANWGWYYDDLGQITTANADIPANNRTYTYDTIGNRLTATADTATTNYWGDVNAAQAGANPLNQYAKIIYPDTSPQTVLPVHDADGNMTSGPVAGAAGMTAGMHSPATANLKWDAEDRPIVALVNGTTVTYQYDHLGRLIRRDDGSTVTQYLYDGWNRIAEYNVTTVTDPTAVTTYTLTKTFLWGLDLSGTLQGAGGVGGLLSIQTSSASFYPTYDGNGNVSEYIDNSGVQSAHFEYDPFGNLTVLTESSLGSAAQFAYRFSTKPQDAVTGLYYYGHRWYGSLDGRWPSRDPIEEDGGLNMYGFVGNDGVGKWDKLGLEYGLWTRTGYYDRQCPPCSDAQAKYDEWMNTLDLENEMNLKAWIAQAKVRASMIQRTVEIADGLVQLRSLVYRSKIDSIAIARKIIQLSNDCRGLFSERSNKDFPDLQKEAAELRSILGRYREVMTEYNKGRNRRIDDAGETIVK